MPLDLADRPQQAGFPIHPQSAQHVLSGAVEQGPFATVKRIFRRCYLSLVQSAFDERCDEIRHHHAGLTALQVPVEGRRQGAVRILVVGQAQLVEVDCESKFTIFR